MIFQIEAISHDFTWGKTLCWGWTLFKIEIILEDTGCGVIYYVVGYLPALHQ